MQNGYPQLSFLEGLADGLKGILVAQLRDLWTHTSTAIEGNTLTLGDTAFVLAEGLTVAGKPLKDHEEVVGHARAIDLLYGLVARAQAPVTETDLFALHQAVQTTVVMDIYAPVGAWKVERNWTNAISPQGQPVIIEYAPPADVPALMRAWLEWLNHCSQPRGEGQEALVRHYALLHAAFVRIHPLADGNGRMARLLANLPLLRAGWPPLVIPTERRLEYLRALAAYELEVGTARADSPMLPPSERLEAFVALCHESYSVTLDLVEAARRAQRGGDNP